MVALNWKILALRHFWLVVGKRSCFNMIACISHKRKKMRGEKKNCLAVCIFGEHATEGFLLLMARSVYDLKGSSRLIFLPLFNYLVGLTKYTLLCFNGHFLSFIPS